MTKTASKMTKPKRSSADKTDAAIKAALSKVVNKKTARKSSSRSTATPSARKPARTVAKRTGTSTPQTFAESTLSTAMSGVAGQLISWADKFSEIAAPIASMSLALATSQLKSGSGKAATKAAGALLRQAREAVGMTAQEVGKAIDLKDAALLEQAETGKAALPFEVVLRLAGVLGRHDPVSFALKLTRSYNPELWSALDALGIGKLAVQAGRERELANIYRRRDAARKLSDKEFAALLTLVGAAFDMGLEFRGQ